MWEWNIGRLDILLIISLFVNILSSGITWILSLLGLRLLRDSFLQNRWELVFGDRAWPFLVLPWLCHYLSGMKNIMYRNVRNEPTFWSVFKYRLIMKKHYESLIQYWNNEPGVAFRRGVDDCFEVDSMDCLRRRSFSKNVPECW